MFQQTRLDLIFKLVQENIDFSTKLGNTALHIAVDDGDIKVVDALLKNGADINKQGAGLCTPLIIASFNGDVEMIKLLLKNKADETKKDIDGNTALYWAKHMENTDVIDLLEHLIFSKQGKPDNKVLIERKFI